MNLQKRGDICSCIISAVGLGSKAIAFLRNVELQESAEQKATDCFVPLKGYFFC